jgi:hypothetical protein
LIKRPKKGLFYSFYKILRILKKVNFSAFLEFIKSDKYLFLVFSTIL